MPTIAFCPLCGAAIDPTTATGKTVRCPSCHHVHARELTAPASALPWILLTVSVCMLALCTITAAGTAMLALVRTREATETARERAALEAELAKSDQPFVNRPVWGNDDPFVVDPPDEVAPPFDVDPKLTEAGNKVYLTEMTPFAVRNGPWQLGKGTCGDPNNTPVKVGGLVHDKGLGMHPDMRARYVLAKKARRFRTGAALNDHTDAAQRPAVFVVLGDGKVLWQSRPIQDRAEADQCDVDVSNVRVLELRTTGNGFAVHAVWVDPVLLKDASVKD